MGGVIGLHGNWVQLIDLALINAPKMCNSLHQDIETKASNPSQRDGLFDYDVVAVAVVPNFAEPSGHGRARFEVTTARRRLASHGLSGRTIRWKLGRKLDGRAKSRADVGNAVPPLLANKVAGAVAKYLAEARIEPRAQSERVAQINKKLRRA